VEIIGGVFGVVLTGVLCFLGFALYLLPSIIGRNKRNSGALIALNILLGWTFIGWVVALVWSLTADQPTVVLMQQPLQQVLPPASLRCSACGQFSPPQSLFCQTCGRSLGEVR
jgi:hypothetical protein